MLSMTAAIKAAQRLITIDYWGPSNYKLLTPYRRDDLDGTMYSSDVGSYKHAVYKRTRARGELALWLMGYDTSYLFITDETTVRDIVRGGMETLPRRTD
jgi:hypothetical protein